MHENFFNMGDKLICINFDKQTMKNISKISLQNVRNIHIFVFDVDWTDADCLFALSNICREHRIKCIIRCFTESDRGMLRRQLKGVLKDQYFHFHLEKTGGRVLFNYSDAKSLAVSYRNVTITLKIHGCDDLVHEMTYSYAPNKETIKIKSERKQSDISG